MSRLSGQAIEYSNRSQKRTTIALNTSNNMMRNVPSYSDLLWHIFR